MLSLIGLWFGGPLWAAEVPLADQPHLRRPIAAAWLVQSKLLAVANQRSGSISIVDIENGKVLREVLVGERLADVAALPSAGWLLAVDEKRHELVVLQWEAGDLQIAQRIPVSRYPVSIAVSQGGTRCTVASLWSRTITTFGIEPAEAPAPPTLTNLNELVLSFAPSEQIYLPDGEHVLVADAFTGRMALLDVTAQKVVQIPANHIFRIYGMALSTDPGGLYIGHQALRPLMASPKAQGASQNNDKAKALTNFVGEYSIAGLLQGRLERFVGNREAPARSGYFEGDLRQMAELAPGLLTVTTQRRRQALVPAAGQPRVRLRRFWDDLVVSDPDQSTRETNIKLGPVGALTAADRGEALFYDTSLSATGWMSCHTCHPDGHTTGQTVDTMGDGSKGTHKRVLTLLGSGLTKKWAWSGEVRALNAQVFQSLKTTMGKQSTPQIVNDITAFVQTLPPPPPLKPALDDPADDDPDDKAQLSRGEVLFQSLGCADCHVPAQGYTSDATYDVGLRDEKRMTRFNPPSLRGVSQGYSFFHDGRATKLEDVFVTHRHPHGEALPDDQLADLLRYLSSL
ncbi:MAG: hypothetical protein L0211_22720 [Planctomycetaceae bacterium]|nr:hypothetical protein [Planctomycetaceae bacterium]